MPCSAYFGIVSVHKWDDWGFSRVFLPKFEKIILIQVLGLCFSCVDRTLTYLIIGNEDTGKSYKNYAFVSKIIVGKKHLKSVSSTNFKHVELQFFMLKLTPPGYSILLSCDSMHLIFFIIVIQCAWDFKGERHDFFLQPSVIIGNLWMIFITRPKNYLKRKCMLTLKVHIV